MTLTAQSSIREVIVAVARALENAGIKAVLVGGACATIYSGGTYTSEDLDLIIQSGPTRRELDDAMATIGFKRREAQYFHARTDLFVEFPRGPLAIGRDLAIRPISLRVGRGNVQALSATDSCRDRLAAFYHWGDREALAVAVTIARKHRVRLAAIRRWSAGEGALQGFETFKMELLRASEASRKIKPRGKREIR